LVLASVAASLETVESLRPGREGAREMSPVKPVGVELVDATIDHVSVQVGAMIRLQFLTGMRPGEVVLMRRADLDTSGKVWTYTPRRHKAAVHGHSRSVLLGPKAQEVLRPFLKPDLSAHLFSPADAERHRREREHAAPVTAMGCGNRPWTNRRPTPAKAPSGSSGRPRRTRHAKSTTPRDLIPVAGEQLYRRPGASGRSLRRAASCGESRHWTTRDDTVRMYRFFASAATSEDDRTVPLGSHRLGFAPVAPSSYSTWPSKNAALSLYAPSGRPPLRSP
jgi:integrase